MFRLQSGLSTVLGLAVMTLAGCESAARSGADIGPNSPAIVEQSAWNVGPVRGKVIRTPSYEIYSTVENQEFNQALAQVMEGAVQQYQSLAPGTRIDPRPMECYVFANRRQWADFTKQRTGSDAGIYLQINRGGYTVRDFFVAYWIGDNGTYAVAAHEGWHQFVARNCKQRLPPFLEEGIATTFENIRFTPGNLPRWDNVGNLARAQRLKKAVEADDLWPLGELVGMHAGDVVGEAPDRIEAFYAQSWAFARFLRDGDAGAHRPALKAMLADAVAGTLHGATGASAANGKFNPRAVKPMLEHYLQQPFDQIEAGYRRHIRKIVDTEIPRDTDAG